MLSDLIDFAAVYAVLGLSLVIGSYVADVWRAVRDR
jgi:hypothetical protein